MIRTHHNVKRLVMTTLAMGSAALALLWPQWRAELRAQGYRSCGTSVVVEFDAAGEPRKIVDCIGECDLDQPDQVCDIDQSRNRHGGKRKWCDCEDDGRETGDCHVVLIRLGRGEGGPKTILRCAGSLCPGPDDVCITGQEPDKLEVLRVLPNGNQLIRVSCCRIIG